MSAAVESHPTYAFAAPDLSDDGLAKVTAEVAETAAQYDAALLAAGRRVLGS